MGYSWREWQKTKPGQPATAALYYDWLTSDAAKEGGMGLSPQSPDFQKLRANFHTRAKEDRWEQTPEEIDNEFDQMVSFSAEGNSDNQNRILYDQKRTQQGPHIPTRRFMQQRSRIQKLLPSADKAIEVQKYDKAVTKELLKAQLPQFDDGKDRDFRELQKQAKSNVKGIEREYYKLMVNGWSKYARDSLSGYLSTIESVFKPGGVNMQEFADIALDFTGRLFRAVIQAPLLKDVTLKEALEDVKKGAAYEEIVYGTDLVHQFAMENPQWTEKIMDMGRAFAKIKHEGDKMAWNDFVAIKGGKGLPNPASGAALFPFIAHLISKASGDEDPALAAFRADSELRMRETKDYLDAYEDWLNSDRKGPEPERPKGSTGDYWDVRSADELVTGIKDRDTGFHVPFPELGEPDYEAAVETIGLAIDVVADPAMWGGFAAAKWAKAADVAADAAKVAKGSAAMNDLAIKSHWMKRGLDLNPAQLKRLARAEQLTQKATDASKEYRKLRTIEGLIDPTTAVGRVIMKSGKLPVKAALAVMPQKWEDSIRAGTLRGTGIKGIDRLIHRTLDLAGYHDYEVGVLTRGLSESLARKSVGIEDFMNKHLFAVAEVPMKPRALKALAMTAADGVDEAIVAMKAMPEAINPDALEAFLKLKPAQQDNVISSVGDFRLWAEEIGDKFTSHGLPIGQLGREARDIAFELDKAKAAAWEDAVRYSREVVEKKDADLKLAISEMRGELLSAVKHKDLRKQIKLATSIKDAHLAREFTEKEFLEILNTKMLDRNSEVLLEKVYGRRKILHNTPSSKAQTAILYAEKSPNYVKHLNALAKQQAALKYMPQWVPHMATEDGVYAIMDRYVKQFGSGRKILMDPQMTTAMRRKFIKNNGVPLSMEQVEHEIRRGNWSGTNHRGKPIDERKNILFKTVNHPLFKAPAAKHNPKRWLQELVTGRPGEDRIPFKNRSLKEHLGYLDSKREVKWHDVSTADNGDVALFWETDIAKVLAGQQRQYVHGLKYGSFYQAVDEEFVEGSGFLNTGRAEYRAMNESEKKLHRRLIFGKVEPVEFSTLPGAKEVMTRYPKAQHWLVDKDIGQALLRVHRNFSSDEATVFLTEFNKVWSAHTLLPFPAFHAHNQVGNWMMMNAAGMFDTALTDPAKFGDDMRIYAKAKELQRISMGRDAFGRKLTSVQQQDALANFKLRLNGKTFSGTDLITDALKHGSINNSWFGELLDIKTVKAMDIGAAAITPPGRIMGAVKEAGVRINPLTAFKQPGKFGLNPEGARLAEFIEQGDRLALHLWELNKGTKGHMAGMSVKRHLGNYHRELLSDWERNLLVPTFPFYRFLQHNYPRTIEWMLTNPRFRNKVMMTRRAQHYGEERSDLPMALRGGALTESAPPIAGVMGSAPIWYDKKRGIQTVLGQEAIDHRADVFSNIFPKNIAELGSYILSQATPLVQIPAEWVPDKALHTGQQVSGRKGRKRFLGYQMNGYLVSALRKISRAANVANQFGLTLPGGKADPRNKKPLGELVIGSILGGHFQQQSLIDQSYQGHQRAVLNQRDIRAGLNRATDEGKRERTKLRKADAAELSRVAISASRSYTKEQEEAAVAKYKRIQARQEAEKKANSLARDKRREEVNALKKERQ